MSWVGYHTAPNLDPHCTLAWWPPTIDLGMEAYDVFHEIRVLGPVEAWVTNYEKFGVRRDIHVAMLDGEHVLGGSPLWKAVKIAERIHRSEWPTRPHVTAHEGRNYFNFRWLGLHSDTRHEYALLGDLVKGGR